MHLLLVMSQNSPAGQSEFDVHAARDGRVKIPAPTIFYSGMPFRILRRVRVFSIWAVRTFETPG